MSCWTAVMLVVISLRSDAILALDWLMWQLTAWYSWFIAHITCASETDCSLYIFEVDGIDVMGRETRVVRTIICLPALLGSILDFTSAADLLSWLAPSVDWISHGFSSTCSLELVSSDLSDVDFVDFSENLVELLFSTSVLFEIFLSSFLAMVPASNISLMVYPCFLLTAQFPALHEMRSLRLHFLQVLHVHLFLLEVQSLCVWTMMENWQDWSLDIVLDQFVAPKFDQSQVIPSLFLQKLKKDLHCYWWVIYEEMILGVLHIKFL